MTIFTQNLAADAQSFQVSTSEVGKVQKDRQYSIVSFINGVKYRNDNLLPHPLVFSIISTKFVNNS